MTAFRMTRDITQYSFRFWKLQINEQRVCQKTFKEFTSVREASGRIDSECM